MKARTFSLAGSGAAIVIRDDGTFTLITTPRLEGEEYLKTEVAAIALYHQLEALGVDGVVSKYMDAFDREAKFQ